MAIIGPMAVKVTPIITGMRIPTGPIPMAWMMVTIPQAKRSALIRKAMSVLDRPSAAPSTRGMATAPAYITITCWHASRSMRRYCALFGAEIVFIKPCTGGWDGAVRASCERRRGAPASRPDPSSQRSLVES